jgi:hypothetical protein
LKGGHGALFRLTERKFDHGRYYSAGRRRSVCPVCLYPSPFPRQPRKGEEQRAASKRGSVKGEITVDRG